MFEDLIEKGLVTKKVYGGLTLYKYSKKVFYNNLWNLSTNLLESRGIVLNSNGDIVHRPFKKVFNLYENGTKVGRDKEVIAVRKVNGFMGAVTNSSTEGIIYGTTGSLDSSFSHWVRESTETKSSKFKQGYTYLFEVVHKEDPHIIRENEGVYLIGMRDVKTGDLQSEAYLDMEAKLLGFYRPKWKRVRFSDLVEESKTVDHEGFMVIDPETNEHLCKIKSPHYLSTKFLMRMGSKKVGDMFYNPETVKQLVDEEFYSIIDHIVTTYTLDSWSNLTDQERRNAIENYILN